MTVLRTKGLCTKVTDEEYAMFERLADGETLSEWVRDTLLKAIATPPADPVVVAELLAFRSIVLNLLFKIANGEPVTADVMQGVIDQADGERVRRVHERLALSTDRSTDRLGLQRSINKDVVRRILAVRYQPSQTRQGRPGSQRSDTRRTVCGASICFDANLRCCAHTGCSVMDHTARVAS
jgi:hypothetical protein